MNMPPDRVTKPSLAPRKSSTPPWLQRIFVGATLLAIGNWAASQYSKNLTNKSVFDYKSTVRGQVSEQYGSTLTEPWSQVSDLVLVQVNGNEKQYL